jgi:hypothetical protein
MSSTAPTTSASQVSVRFQLFDTLTPYVLRQFA